MLLHHDHDDGVEVLSVSGDICEDEVGQVTGAVECCLRESSRGVVVDFTDMTRLPGKLVTALRAVASAAGPWPRPTFGVTAPAVLQPSLADLPVRADRADALSHVDDRSAAPRERVGLPHSVHGPAQARAVVAAATQRLGLEAVSDDVALLVSEMVTNAVRYATAPVALEIEADGTSVLVAVADGSPVPPVVRPADDQTEGGRGMLLVELLSREHGVRLEGLGKTVWAVLDQRGSSRSPCTAWDL